MEKLWTLEYFGLELSSFCFGCCCCEFKLGKVKYCATSMLHTFTHTRRSSYLNFESLKQKKLRKKFYKLKCKSCEATKLQTFYSNSISEWFYFFVSLKNSMDIKLGMHQTKATFSGLQKSCCLFWIYCNWDFCGSQTLVDERGKFLKVCKKSTRRRQV